MPISDEHPAGEDLKWDAVYEDIKNARKPGGGRDLIDDGTEETPPDWSAVRELAIEALNHRTKDLMLAGYLTEALINQHGFAGVRDGFRLLNELLERFWDQVYPQISEDGDLESRLAPLLWCAEPDRGGRLPLLIREARLVPNFGEMSFSWNYWESCFPKKGQNEAEVDFAARKQFAEERFKAYQSAVNTTGRDQVQNTVEDLEACLKEISRFGDIVQRRFDRLAPGISPLRKALEDCADLLKGILKSKGGPASEAESTESGSTETGGFSGISMTAGAIRSRAEAFNRLEEIAVFLKQIEPHSPVSYLVQRAVNWGRMSFEELLQELLKDPTVRIQVGELLGIKTTEAAAEQS